ncbi:MAG TPA: hypothetical protein VFR04_08475 [Solirubrobacterales bacterium]|nr:hypothetical protein [Solirubrobacterales bacterium]
MARGLGRIGGVGVAGAVVLVLALGLVSTRALGGASASPDRPTQVSERPIERLLRLHDLPPGFYLLETASTEIQLPSIGCAAIEPADPQPRLARFLRRYSPSGCMALYVRMYRAPGQGPDPTLAGSGAIELPSVEAAEMGLAVSRELLSHLFGDEPPQEVQPPETIGDASRLFRWEGQSLFGSDEPPSSVLVWRSGNVVAATFASGYRSPPADQTAVELARLQQKHVEAPTPYTPSELDDAEVGLENPNLDVPVYWLGRRFGGNKSLRPLKLVSTGSSEFSPPGVARVDLVYSDRPSSVPAEMVQIDLWSPDQWRQLEAKRKRLPHSLRCATARKLKLPNGRAVIFSGFERASGNCRKHSRRSYTARVRLPGVVVTVETATVCATCAEPGRGAYDSFGGMATVVRGLEPRIGASSP